MGSAGPCSESTEQITEIVTVTFAESCEAVRRSRTTFQRNAAVATTEAYTVPHSCSVTYVLLPVSLFNALNVCSQPLPHRLAA